MIGFFITLAMDIIDLFIYRYYLDVFVQRRKTKDIISVFFILAGSFVWATINHYNEPFLNLIVLPLILILYTGQYQCKKITRCIAVVLYMGAGMIAEPLGLLIFHYFDYRLSEGRNYTYYFVVIFTELIRFNIVIMFCKLKKQERLRVSSFPSEIKSLLIGIPLVSTFISCSVVVVAVRSHASEIMYLCLSIIVGVTLVNFLLLYMVERFNEYMNKKYEAQRYILEMEYKDMYYQEVEECNEKIRQIKHDTKNRIVGLLGLIEKGDTNILASELKKIQGELDAADSKIYSSNPIVNSVLRVKCAIANSKNIKVEYHINIPKRMQLDHADIGVMYGNLLDNAIEACEKLPEENRWIVINNKYVEGKYLLSIKNAKAGSEHFTGKTTKKDKFEHGRGLLSVKNVVEKYNGSIFLEDHGEDFEAYIMLYGIENKSENQK